MRHFRVKFWSGICLVRDPGRILASWQRHVPVLSIACTAWKKKEDKCCSTLQWHLEQRVKFHIVLVLWQAMASFLVLALESLQEFLGRLLKFLNNLLKMHFLLLKFHVGLLKFRFLRVQSIVTPLVIFLCG